NGIRETWDLYGHGIRGMHQFRGDAIRCQNAVGSGYDKVIVVLGPLQADGAGLVLLIDLGELGGARLGAIAHPQLHAIGLILSQEVGSSLKIETLEKREGRTQAGGGPW